MSAIVESLNAISIIGLAAFLNTLWLAFAVALVMRLALRLMPRINGATRHAAWWVVLALVVLVPFSTLLHRPSPPLPGPARVRAQSQTPVVSSYALKPRLARRVEPAAPPILPSGQRPTYDLAGAAPQVHLPVEFHPGKSSSVLLFLWMAVSIVLLGRIMRSYLHLRRLRNRAQPAGANLVARFKARLRDCGTSRAPQLLVSDEVISPLVAGFLHPAVILPKSLLQEIAEPELDYVLLHELAHVSRRDNWTNLVGRLASAVLVLHPVAAWVLRRIEREREIACDDWVVASTGSAFHYAETLARVFEYCRKLRPQLLATGMAHRSSNLGERIKILLRPRLQFSPGASLVRVFICVAACLALLISGARMPGWIALANDTTVAVHDQAAPQSKIGHARNALALEPAAIAAPAVAATPSPAHLALQPSVAAPASQTDQDTTWRHEWKLARPDSNSNKIRLSLIVRDDNGNDRMNTEDVPLSSLPGFSLSMLDHDGPVKFEYVRDAGSIVCEGRVVGGRASGPFTVVLNSSFVSSLEKMGYAAPREEEAFSLVTSDITLAYAQGVRETGSTSSVSDLIELRDHGVRVDYLKAIKAAGPNLSIGAIDSLFDHGVEPEYYKSLKSAAPQLSVEQIDSLFDHGVKPEYYHTMKSTNPELSIEQIDSLFDHGVSEDSYKGFTAVDRKLSIEEIDSLYDHGVRPEYYRTLKLVDPSLSIEQIDSLFDHGVKADSYKGFASVAPKLSIEEIDSLFDHGVKPEYYQTIKATDTSISIEQVNRLRDHGVEPEYLKEIRALPEEFSIADISQLRDHGITAKYIQKLHEMGMKNLTAIQIVQLREGN